MNTFIVALLASLALVSAKPSGHGVVVAGPSGVVTGHGAGLGWAGHGAGLGWAGHGAGLGWAGNGWAGHGHDGQWRGEGLWESQWHGDVGHLHGGAALIAPAAAAVVGHAGVLGHGLGLGHGAVVAGPAGRIVANGVYGAGHGVWGTHW